MCYYMLLYVLLACLCACTKFRITPSRMSRFRIRHHSPLGPGLRWLPMMAKNDHRVLSQKQWRRSDVTIRCSKTSLHIYSHHVFEHRIVTSLHRRRVWLKTRWSFSAIVLARLRWAQRTHGQAPWCTDINNDIQRLTVLPEIDLCAHAPIPPETAYHPIQLILDVWRQWREESMASTAQATSPQATNSARPQSHVSAICNWRCENGDWTTSDTSYASWFRFTKLLTESMI